MSRSIFLSLGLLLLLASAPLHKVQAANPLPACAATDVPSLQNCVQQLKQNLTNEIDIKALIPCAGPLLDSNQNPTKESECQIALNGPQAPSSVLITGIPSAASPIVGLQHTGYYYDSLIVVAGWHNVTLSNFAITEVAADTSVTVNGAYTNTTNPTDAVFCGAPAVNSLMGYERVQGKLFTGPNDSESCPVPGYVGTTSTDPKTNDVFYDDYNPECLNSQYITYINSSSILGCSPTISIINGSQNITLSGMTVDHSQGTAIWVDDTVNFYLLNSFVGNSFAQGLNIDPQSANVPGTYDVSIEGNTFFANRGAGVTTQVFSSSSSRPSDISNNIFDHNQHGDAFSNGHEGVQGGQLNLVGGEGSGDFIVYGNKFLNGYMDFFDSQVFEEYFYAANSPNNCVLYAQCNTTDTFTNCNLSTQCLYYCNPAKNNCYGSADYLTVAGTLWQNGGGVNDGGSLPYCPYSSVFPYSYCPDNGGQPHYVMDIELSDDPGDPLGQGVVFGNNALDNASNGAVFDDDSAPEINELLMYDNEILQDYLPSGNPSQIGTNAVWEYNDCYNGPCNVTSNTTPQIVNYGFQVGSCDGGKNCVSVYASEAWMPQYNSLSLSGSNGTALQCELFFYDTNGSLLATESPTDPGTSCSASGGTFNVPGPIAVRYSSVQIAFENLSTGKTSAMQTVTFPSGLVPNITSVGEGCSNQCVWLNATDYAQGQGYCWVSIFDSNHALITTLSGSQVNCVSGGATFTIPSSLNGYHSVYVQYGNSIQDTWSNQAALSLN